MSPAICPSASSTTRAAPSLHRVPSGWVPRLPRYYRPTPTPATRFRGHKLREGRPLASPPASLRLLRSAVPPLAPPSLPQRRAHSPRTRTISCAAPAPRLLRWRRRDLPGSWATPCVHAPLPDPGGAPAPGPFGTDVGVFRSTDRVDSARVLTFGAPSRGLHAPCVRFAAGVTPAPRNTRFRLRAHLGWSGLSPAGSHRRFPSRVSLYLPSLLSRLCLAQQRFS